MSLSCVGPALGSVAPRFLVQVVHGDLFLVRFTIRDVGTGQLVNLTDCVVTGSLKRDGGTATKALVIDVTNILQGAGTASVDTSELVPGVYSGALRVVDANGVPRTFARLTLQVLPWP